MGQIDGEKDSVLTWGGLCGRRSQFRNPACESRLNAQKSAEAIVRKMLQQLAEGPNMK
jgi:hypothetical protein